MYAPRACPKSCRAVAADVRNRNAAKNRAMGTAIRLLRSAAIVRPLFCVGLSLLTGPGFAAAPIDSSPPGSFTLVQPMKQFRRRQTATTLLDGKVLVAGGAPLAQARTSELYDPVTATWSDS